MPSTASVTDLVEVDWEAAVQVAAGLGRATLVQVANRDADTAREWCLRMADTMAGEFNAPRALSYLELAVILGHRQPEAEKLAERGWRDLLQQTEQLLQAVRIKEQQEAARLKEQKEQEEAARAAAEAEAKPDDQTEASAEAGGPGDRTDPKERESW